MAKAINSTGCKLVQSFSNGTTAEIDFGAYLADYTIETVTQFRDEHQREVTTLVFHKPWVPREEY